MSHTIQSEPEIRFQCRHIRASGRPCGVAALRGQFFCYYHMAARRPVMHRPKSRFYEASLQAFGLPIIEDRLSIQIALSTVISRISSNDVDHKRAGKLLYASNSPQPTSPSTSPRPTSPSTSPRPTSHQSTLQEVPPRKMRCLPQSLNQNPNL